MDCAILLCLAGGWPKSAECTLAYATFIRRVTPWPIEPPLQIWRCPMGASYEGEPTSPMQRLYEVTFPDAQLPMQSIPTGSQEATLTPNPAVFRDPEYRPDAASILQLVAGQGSDLDISDPIYDFVRSIKVWDVRSWRHVDSREDGCREWGSISLGSYGTQGDFSWQGASSDEAPVWVIPSKGCPTRGSVRGVGVEWTDHAGKHGYEFVSY
ncbi:hypothetical protein GZH79_13230 [Loktanella sp. SALINAS62]|nr:hypothetical protein [Loktanella sp. SALINAS62]